MLLMYARARGPIHLGLLTPAVPLRCRRSRRLSHPYFGQAPGFVEPSAMQ